MVPLPSLTWTAAMALSPPVTDATLASWAHTSHPPPFKCLQRLTLSDAPTPRCPTPHPASVSCPGSQLPSTPCHPSPSCAGGHLPCQTTPPPPCFVDSHTPFTAFQTPPPTLLRSGSYATICRCPELPHHSSQALVTGKQHMLSLPSMNPSRAGLAWFPHH